MIALYYNMQAGGQALYSRLQFISSVSGLAALIIQHGKTWRTHTQIGNAIHTPVIMTKWQRKRVHIHLNKAVHIFFEHTVQDKPEFVFIYFIVFL